MNVFRTHECKSAKNRSMVRSIDKHIFTQLRETNTSPLHTVASIDFLNIITFLNDKYHKLHER